MSEEMKEYEYYTLTDEDGNETDFELLASAEIEGTTYYALVPVEESDNEYAEYVVLRLEKDENGEDVLVTIEDDDEFDRVADYFDDLLQSEIDYDAGATRVNQENRLKLMLINARRIKEEKENSSIA